MVAGFTVDPSTLGEYSYSPLLNAESAGQSPPLQVSVTHSRRTTSATPPTAGLSRASVLGLGLATVASLLALQACGGDSDFISPDKLVHVGSIAVDSPSFAIERGSSRTLTATVRDPKGQIVAVPLAWRTTNDSIATFLPDGKLLARDTGVVGVTASALGVTSEAIGVHVVWVGAASVDTARWTAPAAASPLGVVNDSIHVKVKNRVGGPVPGAHVRFAVTAGGGTIAPDSATTDSNGVAAARWTLGPDVGVNSVTATVVDDNGDRMTWVAGNPVTFSVKTFDALKVVAGDAQTGMVMSPLGTAPVVKLVDSLGEPRVGVPVTFTAVGGGRVKTPTVSTGADGSASPGTWTLGDVTGDQTLVVTVESARLVMHATATGTAVYFEADQVAAGGFATCARLASGNVSCWGYGPSTGTGDTTNKSMPAATSGNVSFSMVASGPTHFCGVGTDQSVYCWGTNALADTSGTTISTLAPAKLGSSVSWKAVTAGFGHNCALALDYTAYCWGDNSRGELGDLTDSTRFQPAPVSGGFNWKSLSAGSAFTCGLSTANAALCWGANNNGQLGDGTLTDRTGPTAVAGNKTYMALGTGESWACGLEDSEKVACWGFMVATQQVQKTPLEYDDAPAFIQLSVGGGHACALTSDGTAYCWGANNGGQLGDSTTVARDKPTPVKTTMKFTSISAGYIHTCGRTSDGVIACWGLNRYGELGDSTATFRLMPRAIVTGTKP